MERLGWLLRHALFPCDLLRSNFVLFQSYTKNVRALLGITSQGDHCVLATKAEDPSDGEYALLVCNAISTPVDSKFQVLV